MEAPTRFTDKAVNQLRNNPSKFDFFQAIQLLEEEYTSSKPNYVQYSKSPLACHIQPHNEFVRFNTHIALNFPTSSILRSSAKSSKQVQAWKKTLV